MLIVINLVFGFTIPNINNIAHLGGLAAGFLLGFALSPGYAVGYGDGELSGIRQLIDERTTGMRVLVVAAAVLALLALVVVGNQRWA